MDLWSKQTASGTKWSDRWTYRVFITKTRRDEWRVSHAWISLVRMRRKQPWRQPKGKSTVSLINSHTIAIRIGWHLWEIDLRFAPGLPPGRDTDEAARGCAGQELHGAAEAFLRRPTLVSSCVCRLCGERSTANAPGLGYERRRMPTQGVKMDYMGTSPIRNSAPLGRPLRTLQ